MIQWQKRRCQKKQQKEFNPKHIKWERTRKFDYELKEFFERYLQKLPNLEISNVAEFLKGKIISIKKDIEKDIYNLKLNREVIEIFKEFVKNNPDLGFIEGDEFIRDIIRKKMEELKQHIREE